MDKLECIFEMQQLLDQDIIEKRRLEQISSSEWIQKKTLAMLDELSELLNEVNYKWWKNPKPIDEAALKGELVDILHFFVSMCLSAGMDARELFELYKAKNQENFDRQYGRSQKPGYDFRDLEQK
jgi:dimeric dUTPase (all-alpha-NTP-PPase superfamily)